MRSNLQAAAMAFAPLLAGGALAQPPSGPPRWMCCQDRTLDRCAGPIPGRAEGRTLREFSWAPGGPPGREVRLHDCPGGVLPEPVFQNLLRGKDTPPVPPGKAGTKEALDAFLAEREERWERIRGGDLQALLRGLRDLFRILGLDPSGLTLSEFHAGVRWVKVDVAQEAAWEGLGWTTCGQALRAALWGSWIRDLGHPPPYMRFWYPLGIPDSSGLGETASAGVTPRILRPGKGRTVLRGNDELELGTTPFQFEDLLNFEKLLSSLAGECRLVSSTPPGPRPTPSPAAGPARSASGTDCSPYDPQALEDSTRDFPLDPRIAKDEGGPGSQEVAILDFLREEAAKSREPGAPDCRKVLFSVQGLPKVWGKRDLEVVHSFLSREPPYGNESAKLYVLLSILKREGVLTTEEVSGWMGWPPGDLLARILDRFGWVVRLSELWSNNQAALRFFHDFLSSLPPELAQPRLGDLPGGYLNLWTPYVRKEELPYNRHLVHIQEIPTAFFDFSTGGSRPLPGRSHKVFHSAYELDLDLWAFNFVHEWFHSVDDLPLDERTPWGRRFSYAQRLRGPLHLGGRGDPLAFVSDYAETSELEDSADHAGMYASDSFHLIAEGVERFVERGSHVLLLKTLRLMEIFTMADGKVRLYRTSHGDEASARPPSIAFEDLEVDRKDGLIGRFVLPPRAGGYVRRQAQPGVRRGSRRGGFEVVLEYGRTPAGPYLRRVEVRGPVSRTAVLSPSGRSNGEAPERQRP